MIRHRVLWRAMPVGLKLWAEQQGRFRALCRAHVSLSETIYIVNGRMKPVAWRKKPKQPLLGAKKEENDG